MDVITVLVENADAYWRGFRTTAALAALSFALAFVVGTLIASCRVSPVPPLRRFATFYVALFRNTPLLAAMFLFFFGLPKLGVLFSPFRTAVIVLGLYTGAYMGETIRSGINAVSAGQAEAARAIGLPFRQVLGLIIVPQALRTVVAPIGNLFIANAKNSAIALTIGVSELTGTANRLAVGGGTAVPFLLGAAVIYMVCLLFAGAIFGAIEQRVAIKR